MTQDEVMQMMTDMGLHEGGMDNWVADNAWWKFAKLVAEHEREACAEICKKHADVYALLEQNPHAFGTAKPAWAACIDNRDAIRARGEV
jgi:hypothetical protein